jgi:hypothetical protein
MRRTSSPLIGLLAALMAAAAPPGGEQVHRARLAPPQNPPVPRGLRGFQTARATPKTTPPNVALSPLAPASAVQALSLRPARGFSPFLAQPLAVTDAHACRAACARPYYFCLGGQDSAVCPNVWRECVAACDAPALPTGGVEPVTGPAPQPAAR